MESSSKPHIHGWREALVSVASIDTWVTAYEKLGGWEVRHQGEVTPDTLTFLGLPEGSTATEALLAEPGSEGGMTRLICIGGEHPAIRSNARPWETGGWYDLNSRVADMDTVFREVQKLGWSCESDPITWVFEGNTVCELLVRAPDGMVFALIERIDPPIPADKQPGRLSAHINATQFVADFEAARRFYQDVLGFSPVLQILDQPMLPEPGPHVLGLPTETALQTNWNICLQEAPAGDGGWVEIISLEGISGREFAELADPPNRGLISLRFPVDDLLTLHEHLLTHDVSIVQPPTELELPPFGTLTMLTARGPHGVRLDFLQIK